MLRLALFSLVVAVGLACLSPYQSCNGGCVLDNSQCGQCSNGQYKCPLANQCVDLSAYSTCPNNKGSHMDPTLTIKQRIDHFLSVASQQEKVSMLTNQAPAITRLGIPAFDWLNDDEHGVRNAHATSFPDGCGLGATWSKDSLKMVGQTIAYEARVTYNNLVDKGDRGMGGQWWNQNGKTMTIYAPNLNLVRDPRWGRAQEVYGEDPYLTGTLTVQYVQGIQNGNDSKHMLAAACCKHFAAYDIENKPQDRTVFNAQFNGRNWAETYRPGFEACIVEGKGAHLMCSYNAVNGKPACGSSELLTTVLREQWNFTGFVISDYDAFAQIYQTHHYVNSLEDAAAVGIKAGCDQEGGGTLAVSQIPNAIRDGKLTSADLDQSVRRLLRVRIKLGLLDPPTQVGYNMLKDLNWVEGPANLMKARQVAQKSICLYKNKNSVLPFDKTAVKTIVVIGPQATDGPLLLGNYATNPDKGVVTILDGIKNVFNAKINCTFEQDIDYFIQGEGGSPASNPQDCCEKCFYSGNCKFFTYWQGQCYYKPSNANRKQSAGRVSGRYLNNPNSGRVVAARGCNDVGCGDTSGFNEAITAAKVASHVVVILGLDQKIEAETKDRDTIELPGNQASLVNAVKTAAANSGAPVVCLLVHGGTLALGNVEASCDAIVDAWYPGAQGGNAIADVLFGDYNPAGRTPVTYYKATSDLPPFGNMDLYSGNGVTYRYFKGTPFYPFGYGLSYTNFTYSNLMVNKATIGPCDDLLVSVMVQNTGPRDGDEVIQLYVETPGASVPAPQVRLGDFQRVTIKKGASQKVMLKLKPSFHSVTIDGGSWYDPNVTIEKGAFTISVGGGQPKYAKTLSTQVTVSSTATLKSCRGF